MSEEKRDLIPEEPVQETPTYNKEHYPGLKRITQLILDYMIENRDDYPHFDIWWEAYREFVMAVPLDDHANLMWPDVHYIVYVTEINSLKEGK